MRRQRSRLARMNHRMAEKKSGATARKACAASSSRCRMRLRRGENAVPEEVCLWKLAVWRHALSWNFSFLHSLLFLFFLRGAFLLVLRGARITKCIGEDFSGSRRESCWKRNSYGMVFEKRGKGRSRRVVQSLPSVSAQQQGSIRPELASVFFWHVGFCPVAVATVIFFGGPRAHPWQWLDSTTVSRTKPV